MVDGSTNVPDSPNPPQPARDEARRWVARARDDLAVAVIITNSGAGVSWAACFHAQQAAEKAIKALLVLYGIDFPKTHALTALAMLLPLEAQGALNSDALAELTPWAVAGRYPEDIADPDLATTNRLAAVASSIIELAPASLSSTQPQPPAPTNRASNYLAIPNLASGADRRRRRESPVADERPSDRHTQA